MKSKSNKKQILFLEPGIIGGETKEEAVDRLIEVMESQGFIITGKKQKTADDNAER